MNDEHPHNDVRNWTVVNESYVKKEWKNTLTGERIQVGQETGPFEQDVWVVRVYRPDEVEILDTRPSREAALAVARTYASANNE